MPNIGFIGLGIMGLPMAVNLMQKGEPLQVTGFDVSGERRELFAKAGGKTASSVEEIAAACDLIFLCLPKNELVASVVATILGEGRAGTVIVDTGSTATALIQELAAKARAKGMELIDSPVSGGETGAIAGTLVLMSGGDRKVFDAVRPYLARMGQSVTYMGASGCGSATKIVNNMLVGIHLAALGEAFCFARKAGLDVETLFQAIRSGFAGSAVMDIKAPRLINRDYSASARTAVHQKDLNNAKDLAAHLGVDIPLSMTVLDYMNQLEAMGKADEDHCAVARIYEKAMGLFED
ncbi:2-hydroxy-3-oxopropionate reductase [uncultured delta proteobacterium]|uniref:2-hydroxy-3-oxopropionate reductase n=1 Tax=uncultured delta proteobacterium TaxID=34034 RepID=A0A212IW28_9DELT|nr:2-hydroxy-3-oxopropionate reductase [uncultured delta proteobacterium]